MPTTCVCQPRPSTARRCSTSCASWTAGFVANLALTLDGCCHGAGGPDDFALIAPYAVTEVAQDHMARFVSTATTAVLGRVSAEGFLGYWPNVIGVERADPRDEAYAKWLVAVEKVVLSSTLTEAPGENSCLYDAPAADGELSLTHDRVR